MTEKFINAKMKLGDYLIKEKKMAKDNKNTSAIDLVLKDLRAQKEDLNKAFIKIRSEKSDKGNKGNKGDEIDLAIASGNHSEMPPEVVQLQKRDEQLAKQIKFLEKLPDRVNNLLNDYKSKDDSHNVGIVNKFVDKMVAELDTVGIKLGEADKDGLKNDIRKGLQATQEVFEVQNMSLFERIMFSISKCIGKFFSPEAVGKYENMDQSLEKESGDVVGKWAAKINEKSHSQSNDGHSR